MDGMRWTLKRRWSTTKIRRQLRTRLARLHAARSWLTISTRFFSCSRFHVICIKIVFFGSLKGKENLWLQANIVLSSNCPQAVLMQHAKEKTWENLLPSWGSLQTFTMKDLRFSQNYTTSHRIDTCLHRIFKACISHLTTQWIFACRWTEAVFSLQLVAGTKIVT